MKKRAGFTLLELLVVVAILGILAATAIPLYNTWEQRAYGSEASLTLKSILDGEIMYFLENETFFPAAGQTILISHNDLPTDQDIIDVKDALKISIPTGHFLDFTITNTTLSPQSQSCQIVINHSKNLDLFKNGAKSIIGLLDKTGKIDIGYLP